MPRRRDLWSGEAAAGTARWLIVTWGRERVLEVRGRVVAAHARVLADLGDAATGRAACDEGLAWTRARSRGREGDDARYGLLMARGDLEAASGDAEASVASFAAARELWDPHAVNAGDRQRLLIADANRANALARLGRIAEARALYAEVLPHFEAVGDTAGAAAVRYADAVAARQAQATEAPAGELRAIVRAWEAALREQPDVRNRFLGKRQLDPAYRLLLRALAREGGSAAAADHLRVVQALREPERLADLPDGGRPPRGPARRPRRAPAGPPGHRRPRPPGRR